MSPVRILVVDDEGAVGRDIQNTLVRFGYSVPDIARTGSEALEIVRRTNPELVIMDVQISGPMDGIEAARKIRSDYGNPIIYLTALADEETMARASETDPEGYLLKPFNESELKSAVGIALSRVRSREALVDREERFISTLRSMADGLIATDIVGNITYMNPVAESLTGWGFVDARRMVLQDVFTINDSSGKKVSPLAPRCQSLQSSGRRAFLTRKDGERVLIEDNSAPLKDPQGSLVGLVVVFRRAIEEESVRDSRASVKDDPIRNIVEGIADPLLAVDRHWKITFVNDRAVEIFERSCEDIIGAQLWRILPEEVREENVHDASRAMARRERVTFEFYHKESGSWFEVNAYPFGDGLLLLMRDITERIEESDNALRLEKLESLGLLARGFAHDFNNILTVILGNLSLAEIKLPEGINGGREIEHALAATLRAQNRVQQLLTFAKGGVPIRQRIDLKRIISEIRSDLDRVENIHYNFELADDLWPLDADPGQFRRVVENLLRNAEQAMPEGGRIVLRLDNVPAGSVFRKSLPSSLKIKDESDYIALQILDDGKGVDEDLVDKVFEPYFSTRTDANATGIGLTVCESIARAHHGVIALQSDQQSGTRIVVAFPAAEDRNELVSDQLSVAGDQVSPKILILEDDPLIRELLVANLERDGFRVTETEDGVDTVARYVESYDGGNPFNLVIMDLSIPNGMGGTKAIEEIMQIDPEVKAIVSSGYSDDPAMANPKRFGFSGVLPKPYQPQELLGLVRGLLN